MKVIQGISVLLRHKNDTEYLAVRKSSHNTLEDKHSENLSQHVHNFPHVDMDPLNMVDLNTI